MIRSMTGYGKAEKLINGNKYIAELKAINSKQFDPLIRIPASLKNKELDIRSLLSTRLERGKIEFILSIEESENTQNIVFNRSLLKKYYNEVVALQSDLGLENQELSVLSTLLRMPELFQMKNDIPDDQNWEKILEIITETINNCDSSRIDEGKKLKSDFTNRIELITSLLDQVEPYEAERIGKIREKFRKELSAIFDSDKIDQNRLEQEIIFYIEKIDITEEKVRLRSHCEYFIQTLLQDDSVGKKLGFIAQEIGREINTLGSKANDWNIQRLVVLMKDELEKIKEQLYNIL